jgi:hypothetical protein
VSRVRGEQAVERRACLVGPAEGSLRAREQVARTKDLGAAGRDGGELRGRPLLPCPLRLCGVERRVGELDPRVAIARRASSAHDRERRVRSPAAACAEASARCRAGSSPSSCCNGRSASRAEATSVRARASSSRASASSAAASPATARSASSQPGGCSRPSRSRSACRAPRVAASS